MNIDAKIVWENRPNDCHLCKKCLFSGSQGDPPDDTAVLVASWGFGSHKDGQDFEIHMCEECFDKLRIMINSFWSTTGAPIVEPFIDRNNPGGGDA